MGLLTGLITLPLAPVRGVAWIADQLVSYAEQELYDETRLHAELRSLVQRYELGELGDAEFEVLEDELLEQIWTAHERNQGD
jgi:hypothetical protein